MSDADDIQRFYQAGLEGGRLLEGSGVIELARTQDVLERYLPAPPARVLDVGGGTGVYARGLAGRGYEVHLVDPVPRHVEEARVHPGPVLAGARVGDARRLEHADASAALSPHPARRPDPGPGRGAAGAEAGRGRRRRRDLTLRLAARRSVPGAGRRSGVPPHPRARPARGTTPQPDLAPRVLHDRVLPSPTSAGAGRSWISSGGSKPTPRCWP